MKRQTLILAGTFLLTLALLPLPAQAAVSMVLDAGSSAPGESQVAGHANQIDVLAWSWGMAQSVSGSASGANPGRVSIQSLSLVKYTDAATSPLMTACASGQILPTATLTVRNVAGTTTDFYQVGLTNVRVSSVSQGGSSGQDRLTETVTFIFTEVKVLYFPNLNNLPQPGVDFSWNVAANVGSQAGQIPFDPFNGAAYITDFSAQLTFASDAPMVTLTWSSVAGATYQVLLSDSIEGPFQTYRSFPSAGDGTTAVALPATAAREFFRVEQIPGN
jgi:type VI secretion system secreted protein Hcp